MSDVSELASVYASKLVGVALSCASKEVDELTDDERCAIAFCAGVEMTAGETDYSAPDVVRVRFTTKNPIGIIKVDGKFRVVERVPTEGERLRKLGLLHYED